MESPERTKIMEKLSKNISSNMEYLAKILHMDKNFDLILRVIEVSVRTMAIVKGLPKVEV